MASSIIKAAQSVASQASAAINKQVPRFVESYQKVVRENQQFVVKDPEAAAKLPKQLLYTTLDRLPSQLQHAQKEWTIVRNTNWSELPMATVGLVGAFTVECAGWFTLGEIVGRGFRFFGYQGQ